MSNKYQWLLYNGNDNEHILLGYLIQLWNDQKYVLYFNFAMINTSFIEWIYLWILYMYALQLFSNNFISINYVFCLMIFENINKY